jgi:hypothetical protein
MLTISLLLGSLMPAVSALGGQQCLTFEQASDNDFHVANHGSLVPIITDSSDPASLHLAASTFADDLERVTGSRPAVYNDTVPDWATKVIMVGTASSGLLANISNDGRAAVEGLWEAYDIRVVEGPIAGVEEALVITGSDKVCTSASLNTASEFD